MTTGIDPIRSLDDPRFEQEPWNYRFIVSQNSGDFTATSFEMPGISATAPASHLALNLLAGHMAQGIPEILQPSSRSRPPNKQERGRFMPVHRRLLHAGALRGTNCHGLTFHEPHAGWFMMARVDPARDETATSAEKTLDAADVALWLNPDEGDVQLIQIHNEVYAASEASPAERRWPRQAIEQAVNMPPDPGDDEHPEEDAYLTTVIQGTRGTAVCEGEHSNTPNLLRVKRYDPAPGTTRLDFWNALKQYILDNTSPAVLCQDCEQRPPAYDYRPTGPRGRGPGAFMRLCADCTLQTLLEDMDPNEPKPLLSRL